MGAEPDGCVDRIAGLMKILLCTIVRLSTGLRWFILSAASIVILISSNALQAEDISNQLIVRLDSGLIKGTSDTVSGVRFFGSIPYAEPPVADFRWRPPAPVRNWGETVRDTDRLPPQCMQIPVEKDGLFHSPVEEQSEDCLYLNVWTAARDSDPARPVMLWLHGGGFMQGSSALPMYDGAKLAHNGIVFVSINYRLGALGFLAHPALSADSPLGVSGNYGTLDQIAALQWIQRNISAFGGDPNNITVIGQSAGSMSLNLLTASPLAKGLFHKGIGQTGAVMGMLLSKPLAEAEASGAQFAQLLGASSLTELRSLDANDLVQAAGVVPGTFEPVVDGWILPCDVKAVYASGRQADVPLIIGANKDESPLDPSVSLDGYNAMMSRLFGREAGELSTMFPARIDEEARDEARRVMTLAMGQYPMTLWAELQATTGTAPAFIYRFTRNVPMQPNRYLEQRDTPELGAWHGSEIAYALGNLSTRDWPWTTQDHFLSDSMISYWINFAWNGDPNAENLPDWPAHSAGSSLVMELGDHVRSITDPNSPAFYTMDKRFR